METAFLDATDPNHLEAESLLPPSLKIALGELRADWARIERHATNREMQSRWLKTWQPLGVTAPNGVFAQLTTLYSEPHRKYHTLQHLAECFSLYDAVTTEPKNGPAVELAIWFHDAIYDTSAMDNEEASAVLATQTLAKAGLVQPLVALVSQLILSTRHDAVSSSSIEALVLQDVDLSILGAPASRYEEFEVQIRSEYHWVPDSIFRDRRSEILKGFLARPTIYQLPQIRAQLEQRARQNLAAAIERLAR